MHLYNFQVTALLRDLHCISAILEMPDDPTFYILKSPTSPLTPLRYSSVES